MNDIELINKNLLYNIEKYDFTGEHIKDYLFKPYRFYLKYKYGIKIVDDEFTLFKEGELKEKGMGGENKILFGRIQIDKLDNENKIIYELKKGKQLKEGINQLIFYLFLIEYKYGWKDYVGRIIDVENKNILKEIKLSSEFIIDLNNLIDKMILTLNGTIKKCNKCNKDCSFFTYCNI